MLFNMKFRTNDPNFAEGQLSVEDDLRFRLFVNGQEVASGQLHEIGQPSESFLLTVDGETALQGRQTGFGVCHPNFNAPWGNFICPFWCEAGARGGPHVLTVQLFVNQERDSHSITVYRSGVHHLRTEADGIEILEVTPNKPLIPASV